MNLSQEGSLSRLSREAQRTKVVTQESYNALKPLQPASALDLAMERLDTATDELRSALSSITERLQPVLKQEPTQDGSDEGKSEARHPAPLVAAIDRQSARVQATLASLRELERRLVM